MTSPLKDGVAAADDIRFSAILGCINTQAASREDQALFGAIMKGMDRDIKINDNMRDFPIIWLYLKI